MPDIEQYDISGIFSAEFFSSCFGLIIPFWTLVLLLWNSDIYSLTLYIESM